MAVVAPAPARLFLRFRLAARIDLCAGHPRLSVPDRACPHRAYPHALRAAFFLLFLFLFPALFIGFFAFGLFLSLLIAGGIALPVLLILILSVFALFLLIAFILLVLIFFILP